MAVVNRPKQIGTAAETAVTRYLRVNGFDGAERLALHGTNDEGDITLCPGVMAEIKGGHAAETASDAQVEAWLVETEIERVNRGADIALLVLKRKGKGAASAGQWHAYLPGWAYAELATNDAFVRYYANSLPPVRIAVADAARLIRYGGYGTPLEGISND